MQARSWKHILLTIGISLFAFIGIGGWALASPVGSSPDEDFHLASIWCSWGEREGVCEPASAENLREVPAWLVLSSHCFAFDEEQSASCAPTSTELAPTDRVNVSSNYPPIFYATMGLFVGEDVAVSVISMRLFNTALFVGTVLTLLLLLRSGQRAPLVWAAVFGSVPVGVFFIASANPSSWAVLSGLSVWIALVGYFSADTRGRAIALGAIATVVGVMGAGARSDAASYVAFAAVLATFLTYRRDSQWVKKALLPILLVAVGAFFVLTSGQTSWAVVAGAEALAEPSFSFQDAFSLAVTNFLLLPTLWAGNLGIGKLGWLDTPVHPSVGVIVVAVVGALIIWGLKIAGWRKLVALGATLSALIVLPIYVLHGQHAVVGTEVQPRYILPLVLIFIGVAVFGFANDNLGLNKLQAAVMFAVIGISNMLAMKSTLQRFITGVDVGGLNLNTGIEWWWPISISPMAVWSVSSLSFALALLGIYIFFFTRWGQRLPAEPESESVEGSSSQVGLREVSMGEDRISGPHELS